MTSSWMVPFWLFFRGPFPSGLLEDRLPCPELEEVVSLSYPVGGSGGAYENLEA